MSKCNHEWGQWVTLAGSIDSTRRHCSKCALSQRIITSYKYIDDGLDERVLYNKKSKEDLLDRSKLVSIEKRDPRVGWNEGLGAYVTDVSDYKEIATKQGAVPQDGW